MSEVVGTSPAKTVPESGPMETVGTRRIRPSLIGTGRNYPTDTGSESVCKEPVGSGRFRPSRNDLGRRGQCCATRRLIDVRQFQLGRTGDRGKDTSVLDCILLRETYASVYHTSLHEEEENGQNVDV